ncbi:hypothetical protein RRG08_036609 [Elysia crispata]|uniref:Uncharacterized protein n=1 Tax=Elysia crispata TaxID=231223 RepID=A0AAE0ZQV0_9GAST|nr:hypothetical protein RRG08_036609 [Elysia crispata]
MKFLSFETSICHLAPSDFLYLRLPSNPFNCVGYVCSRDRTCHARFGFYRFLPCSRQCANRFSMFSHLVNALLYSVLLLTKVIPPRSLLWRPDLVLHCYPSWDFDSVTPRGPVVLGTHRQTL